MLILGNVELCKCFSVSVTVAYSLKSYSYYHINFLKDAVASGLLGLLFLAGGIGSATLSAKWNKPPLGCDSDSNPCDHQLLGRYTAVAAVSYSSCSSTSSILPLFPLYFSFSFSSYLLPPYLLFPYSFHSLSP